MIQRRYLFLAGVSSFLMAGCTSLPTGDWRSSLETVRHQTFVQLACTSDGIGRVLLGSLSSGLEGAAIGIGYTGELIGNANEEDAALVLFGTAASIGGGIGLGIGAGQALIKAPDAYAECLKNQQDLLDQIPEA